METSGQSLSPTGQTTLQPYETAPRPLVGFARDYAATSATRWHAHSRAQLLYAIAGVMRIDTRDAAYTVPPTTALFLPADAPHAVRMDGPVAMRALFLREDAAGRVATRAAVITVSPLLREVVLAACAEPLDWALGGRGHHLSELALDEIARAAPLHLDLPMPKDKRLGQVVSALRARPDDPRGLEELAATAGASSRTLARLFRAQTGLSFRQWRHQHRMTEALSALTMGASLAQAATIAGFGGQPAFGAAFRAIFGHTPGEARRRSAFSPGSENTSGRG